MPMTSRRRRLPQSRMERAIEKTTCSCCTCGFDYSKSTHENYCSRSHEFRGPFRSIRAKLDFSYHGNYSVERQELQDDLLMNVVGAGKTRDRPWIVFTAGAMGAGKSHTVNWMNERGYFPIPEMVQVDADNFRLQFPEWPGYVRQDPTAAGQKTHREAGYLVEIAQEAAMAMLKDVWVDGSLRDAAWYAQVFAHIRKQHPEYKIAIIHVHARRAVIFRRIRKREAKTGRKVPFDSVLESIERVPASVAKLAPLADFVVKIDNSSESSEGIAKNLTAFQQIAKRFALPSAALAISSTVSQSIRRLVQTQAVVLFSKSYCTYCVQVKDILRSVGFGNDSYTEIELDTLDTDSSGSVMDTFAIASYSKEVLEHFPTILQIQLGKITGTRTVPQLFINGKLIGSSLQVTRLHASGKLQEIIVEAVVGDVGACDNNNEGRRQHETVRVGQCRL